MIENTEYLKIITWKEIRDEVTGINSELAHIIDRIEPEEKYKFIIATYKFGDLIIKDGELQLPNTSQLSERDKKYFLEELSYSPIPLTLLMNKESEVFVMDEERVIPLKVFKPGKLFGTFETIDAIFGKVSEAIWNVTAGARSIFTLPKISTSTGLNRLRNHFALTADTATHSVSDHWYLFRQIATHESFEEEWQARVVFFTKDWFSFKKKDSYWFDFQNYIFKQGWFNLQQYLRRYQLATQWKTFVKAITQRRLKPTPYIADTFKHLLLLLLGEAPAFRLTNSNIAAPINGLQNVLVNVYQLENYIPHIMHVELPEPDNSDYFYYSLSLPTLFEGSPSSKNNSSTIMYDLKLLKLLIETLQRDSSAENIFFKNKFVEYFHVEIDPLKEIQSTALIPQTDSLFTQDAEQFPGRNFCATSPFWRGCIRIKI